MIYVNCDASWSPVSGIAGIAYTSGVLGSKRQVVRCACATEAELRAVIMAAEDHHGHPALTLRTDSKAAAAPHQGNARSTARIQAQRARLRAVLPPQWRLKWVARGSNLSAHALARSARRIGERALA